MWLKRCAIILVVSAALAAVDSFARPSAWTVNSSTKKESKGADNTAAPVAKLPTDAPATTVTHDANWFSDQLAGGALAIDARTAEKFSESHVPGAIHLPFEAFTKGRPDAVDFLPDDGTLIIIYCDGGDCDASHKVQTMLGQFGIKNTVVFEEGFPGWQKAGLPVETGGGADS